MPVISEVHSNKNTVRPVLVDFQNAKFHYGEEETLRSGLYKSKKNETIVDVKSDKMTYTGVVDDDDLYNNYIVINNKRKNTCKLVQVDFATLKPKLAKKDLLNVSVMPHEKSLLELNKQFGSKKTIRQTEQHERLKMNIDAVKDDLEKTVADIQIDTTDFGSSKDNDNDGVFKPIINREASRREQVYELENLIPRNVLDSLEQETDHVMENLDSLAELKFKPFVEFCIKKLKGMSISEDEQKERLKVLIYVHYLLHYFSVPLKSMTKKFSVCDNKEVNFHILDNFSTPSSSGRLRPISMKTKALCYILVLTVLVMDYEVNTEELSKDIKMGIKKIQEVARVLALSQGREKNIMTLKLPLPAVVSLTPRNKRK